MANDVRNWKGQEGDKSNIGDDPRDVVVEDTPTLHAAGSSDPDERGETKLLGDLTNQHDPCFLNPKRNS